MCNFCQFWPHVTLGLLMFSIHVWVPLAVSSIFLRFFLGFFGTTFTAVSLPPLSQLGVIFIACEEFYIRDFCGVPFSKKHTHPPSSPALPSFPVPSHSFCRNIMLIALYCWKTETNIYFLKNVILTVIYHWETAALGLMLCCLATVLAKIVFLEFLCLLMRFWSLCSLHTFPSYFYYQNCSTPISAN